MEKDKYTNKVLEPEDNLNPQAVGQQRKLSYEELAQIVLQRNVARRGCTLGNTSYISTSVSRYVDCSVRTAIGTSLATARWKPTRTSPAPFLPVSTSTLQ